MPKRTCQRMMTAQLQRELESLGDIVVTSAQAKMARTMAEFCLMNALILLRRPERPIPRSAG